MQPIYTQSFFLSAGETDAEQRMAIPVLTAKLIDIATAHANSLGIGNPAMAHLNAGWVLSRLTIEMIQYPTVNDQYSISTWVESWTRHFSLRDFRIDNEKGEPIGYARSIWMVLDTKNRDNAGLSHLNLPADMIAGNPVPIARQEKHRVILPPNHIGDIKHNLQLAANAPAASHTFKYCDLDAYRHVNTVRYVALLLNQFTLEEFDSSMLQRLELSFLHEAHYNQPVEILRHNSYPLPDSKLLSSAFYMQDSETNAPILYARIIRAPK